MRRMGVLIAIATASLAASAFAQTGGTSPSVPAAPVTLLALPEEEARVVLARRGGVVGLGVDPDARDVNALLDDVGAPYRALPPATVAGAVLPSAAHLPAARVPRAFRLREPLANVRDALKAPLAVVAVRLADDAEAVMRLEERRTFVIGFRLRTPVTVGVILGGDGGVLRGATAGRLGIVTPADLIAGIGVASSPAGAGLEIVPSRRPFGVLDDLARRLERDASYGPGLSKTTAAVGIGAGVLGTVALAARRRGIAAGLTRAAALVPIGYLAGLFVPSSKWEVRAVPLGATVLLGAAAMVRSTRRFCGWALVVTSTVVAVLAVLAAARPDAEPALSLWGNPLESWRLYGLRNHLAGFISGGFLAGAALLAAPWWLVVAGSLTFGAVIGAPAVGANYVGVATFGIGATVLLLGVAGRRVRFVHLPVAGAVGVAAAVAALAADVSSPISHGGRAVTSIRSGGWDAAWEIIRRRAVLNYGEIRELDAIGPIALVLAALAGAWLVTWAMRSDAAPAGIRAGVAGTAIAALVALVAEDSGFLAGGQYLLFPWICAVAFAIDALRSARSGSLDASPSADATAR